MIGILKWFGFMMGIDHRHKQLDQLLTECQSEMEKVFLIAAYQAKLYDYGAIIPQYPIGRFYADFAIPDCKTVIEIDGHDWHSSKEQLAADRKRERLMQMKGWTVIRVTGSEVYADALDCVREVEEIIIRNS